MAVLSHLELWAQLEWHRRYGDDFCGQKTFNSADPALTTVPTKSDRTLAYIYTAEFYNVATCKAYKDGRPAPARTADSGHPASSSTSESSRPKKSSNPPSPARGGAQPAHSTLPAASTGGGGKAPTSQEVTTKEEAQEACVTKYKNVLTANPADCKAALDAAHEELHKYNGLDGLQAATKGPHIKVLVDAGLGTASSSESPRSVKTGAGTSRTYFVPTWVPSKTKRKRVVEDDDSDYVVRGRAKRACRTFRIGQADRRGAARLAQSRPCPPRLREMPLGYRDVPSDAERCRAMPPRDAAARCHARPRARCRTMLRFESGFGRN